MHWRNNLMLGQNSSPAIFSVTTNTNYTSSDYNGFRPNPGRGVVPVEFAAVRGRDDSRPGRAAEMGSSKRGEFATLAEYSKATGQDRNSVLVDYDMFMNVKRLDAQDVASVQKIYKARIRLPTQAGIGGSRSGGELLPITDGFAGSAPDLGALEVGATAPHYGPRQ